MSDTNRIERDLEQTRVRLDATIDALQDKLSPGQMLDQAIAWGREGGGAEFTDNFMRTVRTNPMPVALVGVGLAWLMASRPAPQAGSYPPPAPYPGPDPRFVGEYGNAADEGPGMGEDLARRAREAGERISRRADETAETFQERVYHAKAGVLGVTRSAGETLASFRQRVDDGMSAAADRYAAASARAAAWRDGAMRRGREGYRHAADSAAESAQRMRQAGNRALSSLQEQPLLMAALGISAGALLAFLVPPTRQERETLGPAVRDLASRATAAATQSVSRVANEASGAAREAAEREGLVPKREAGEMAHDAREQVREGSAGVRRTAEAAIHAGSEAARREMGGGQSGATDERRG
ncbi:DUF3618 domain-containing protein [Geminicoccaceae bacterium 1502E]|nr:DUF3618 domain-containing protein [Geminicoccaceae bacterium 1502E]